MQSSKRILRSNELMLPSSGLLDTGLELTFSLQYPHFLKRDGNKLHILLQRRKRYKNRTMLGFKTLAEGTIRMDQVLQKQMDIELELLPENSGKDKTAMAVARLTVLQLSSMPVDQEHKIERDRDFSDEEDEFSSAEEEGADLSDSEPLRSKLPHARHNLKQRFVSLLRRFRVADSEGGRGASLANPSDIQALFQELESLSCDEDSGPEQDTMSISSTPKPSIRPFFSSSRSLLDNQPQLPDTERSGEEKNYSGSDGNADVCWTDLETQADTQIGSPPCDKLPPRGDEGNFEAGERKSKLFRTSASTGKKKNSLSIGTDYITPESIVPRRTFLDQVSRLLPSEETALPDAVLLVTGVESQVVPLCNYLASHHRLFQPLSAPEVRSVLTAVVNKIQKYCNNCAKPSNPIKLVLVGGDTLVGWVLRPYVELLSSRSPEWINYIRIYIVPLGSCTVARHLATVDPGYSNLFPNDIELKGEDLAVRLLRYISLPPFTPVASLSLAEAMLTCQDDSSQLFIPFVNEVRVGPTDNALSVSVDMDDLMCSSPPGPPPLTPPSSPNVQVRESPWEPLELQLDYWQLPKLNENLKTDKPKQDGKISLKGMFRGLQAVPASSSSVCTSLHLTMHVSTKEKKQKIMRLGKKKEKEREQEARSQYVEGISRLICSVRASHSPPMRVFIDGTEWNGVKFFQLSSTWQTHIKNLSVALVGAPLAGTELS
ncbi:hypothetical protein FQA39_LY10792 [Lamprigera yunnana]|nr:hypothetical protein FQA39_LY10792 [Lamprigera yunnana]